MRKILIKVWQGLLTPRQALRDLRRTGLKFGIDKEEEILDVLSAVARKEILVNIAEQLLREGGKYELG